jgi:uncharacterized membrane protein YfcA
MSDLSPFSWFLLVLGATGVGISKSGLAGVSLVHVLVFAYVFGTKASAFVGVVIGWSLLGRLDEATFKPLIGIIIILLCFGQLLRMWRPHLFTTIPHTKPFAWSMGILGGITTMLANAAGPVIALYLLAVSLPKLKLVATGAWFFFVLNIAKIPFSANLGFITTESLLIDLILAPCVVAGLIFGLMVVRRLPQKVFDTFLLAFTAVAAIRMVLI